jgi:dihydrofolate reductase
VSTRVYLACSFDGYIAGSDHDVDWLDVLEIPTESDAMGFEEFLGQVGCMLMGRKTYDFVEKQGTWPYGDLPVLVATHRPLTPVVPTVRAVSGDIADLLGEAQRIAGDADVYLDGGATVQQALNQRLVDELTLTVVPVLLGGGVRLFDDLIERSWWEYVRYERYGEMVQITLRPRQG